MSAPVAGGRMLAGAGPPAGVCPPDVPVGGAGVGGLAGGGFVKPKSTEVGAYTVSPWYRTLIELAPVRTAGAVSNVTAPPPVRSTNGEKLAPILMLMLPVGAGSPVAPSTTTLHFIVTPSCSVAGSVVNRMPPTGWFVLTVRVRMTNAPSAGLIELVPLKRHVA